MPETMTKLEQVPNWLSSLCSGLDTLSLSSPFEKFSQDVELIFGDKSSNGVEEMKAFFIHMDSPLDTKHEVFEVWSGSGRTYVRGQAELAKKQEPNSKTTVPFQWMFYDDPNDTAHLRMWRVTAGPAEAKAEN